MTAPRCSMAPLVEVRRDGRLAPRDVASLERHLSTCAECRALDEDLARIGNHLRAVLPPASPLEHQRARGLLLRSAAQSGARLPSQAWGMRVFAVAAAFAVVVFGTWFATAPKSPPVARQTTAPASPAVRTETTVRAVEGTRLARSTEGGLDLVKLESGAIDVGVKPLGPGERFIIRTDDADVEVRGTLFRVEADEGRLVSVVVTEGKVEVRYRGTSALVPAGGSWHAAPKPETTASASPSSASPSSASPSSASPSSASPSSASPSPAGHSVASRAGSTRAALTPRPSGTNARPSVDAPASGGADADSVDHADTGAPKRDRASKDFAEAVQSMARGDYTGAAERLDAFRAANPDEARAEEAMYLHAIALQRSGHGAEAVEAARRYLARYPNGSFRKEATAIATPR